MILTGFLAGRYARERPLALSASLAFEQHYEEVEGDSASSAELYALLSSLSGIPLDRALAVTGSVNQHGRDPAGRRHQREDRGLLRRLPPPEVSPARQGVLIPEANVRHLMLREDVIAGASREDRFHVHAVSTVDEGLGTAVGPRRRGARG